MRRAGAQVGELAARAIGQGWALMTGAKTSLLSMLYGTFTLLAAAGFWLLVTAAAQLYFCMAGVDQSHLAKLDADQSAHRDVHDHA